MASTAALYYCAVCNVIEINVEGDEQQHWQVVEHNENYFLRYLPEKSFDFAREVPLRPGTDRTYTASKTAATGPGTTGIEFHFSKPSGAKKSHFEQSSHCFKKFKPEPSAKDSQAEDVS